MSIYSGERASKLLIDLIKSAKQSIWVATAFLDEFGADLLVEAVRRGVRVRLLVPEGVDYEILRRLSIEGVEVRIYRSKFLHAESIIVDGVAYVGSANLTANALKARSVELVIETDDANTIKLIDEFEKWWNEAEDIRLTIHTKLAEKFIYFKISKEFIGYNEIISVRFTREPVYIEMLNPFTLNSGMTIYGGGGSISFRYVFIELIGLPELVFYNATTNERLAVDDISLKYEAEEFIRNEHKFFSPYVGNVVALKALGSISDSLSHFFNLVEGLIGSQDFIDLGNRLSEDLLIHVKKFLADNNFMGQSTKVVVREGGSPSINPLVNLRDLAYEHNVFISLGYAIEDRQEKPIHQGLEHEVLEEIRKRFDSYLNDLVKTLDLENYKRLIIGKLSTRLGMVIKTLGDHGFKKLHIPIRIKISIELSQSTTISSEYIPLAELSYSI